MVERGHALKMGAGDELRRVIVRRRRGRRRLILSGLIGCATLPLMASFFWHPPTLLVWNASASVPVGLYRVLVGNSVRRGDMVVAWMPGPARSLAAKRRYLPENVPLVKRVAAAAGDRVCAAGRSVSINGRRVAVRRTRDAAQRPMPWWNGCRWLERGEYFLLMDNPWSFDGRYFGVTRRRDLLGKARLLWVKPGQGSSRG